MIENNVNIDKKSGAYDKKYFLQVAKSYEDTVILATVDEEDNPNFAYEESQL